MLVELQIRNFAIIDKLQVTFGPGFNILTGETGAGKSIILDAFGLLLGTRARPDLIRTGEEEASVEALFDLAAGPDLRTALAEAGFEEGEELLIRRVVSRSGKNRVYINGALARLSQLQPLSSQLTALYGQHEHQLLQRTEMHLQMLDRFGGLEAQVAAYRQAFQEMTDLADRLHQSTTAEGKRQQRLDLLSFQEREIAAAGLLVGEDEELAAERLLLQNAGRLTTVAATGFEALYGAEGAVCERLSTLAGELESLARIEPIFGALAETVRASLYSLEDTAAQLRDYAGSISFDPDRLAQVDERLAQLAALKRKYAPNIADILRLHGEIANEIGELENLEEVRERLEKQLGAARERLHLSGEVLSESRRTAAESLKGAIEEELKDLGMEKARFEVRFSERGEPGSSGLERGEFYLSPNPGEEPKPLAWIASGGELSRIMLALNCAAPEAEGIPTLIFDEVDAGIGGTAATAVGEKLCSVARGRQVLCITHLPQVAAFADAHYRVEKQDAGGRTLTSVRRLDGEEKVRELARMLGGARITETTLEHARDLLSHSRIEPPALPKFCPNPAN